MIKGLFLFLFCVSAQGLTVAVMGMAGSGKSSLVRSLCSLSKEDIVVSHQGDGTLKEGRYENCVPPYNWTVIDTVGYGTAQFPSGYASYVSGVGHIDHLLLCVGYRVYTQDLELHQRLVMGQEFSVPLPITVVRLKCDLHPCSTNQLRYLSAKTFPGTTSFGVSTIQEHEAHRGIAKLISYVQNYKDMRD